MKKKLQEVAAAEKRSASSSGLQRQSSYEHSSRHAGSSSFPGNGHVLGGSLGVSNSSTSTPVGGGLSSSGATSSSTIPGGVGHYASKVGSFSTLAGGEFEFYLNCLDPVPLFFTLLLTYCLN